MIVHSIPLSIHFSIAPMTLASCTTAPPARRPRPSRRLRQRNERVDRYRELVRPISLHYAALCREGSDDLHQVGLLGLIRAAELFNSKEGTPFPAFARHHIRGAILHYLRDQAPTIRLPRRHQELEQQLRRLQRSGRIPQPGPVAEGELGRLLGLSPEQWRRFEQLRQIGRVVPFDITMEEHVASEELEEEPAPDGRALALLENLDRRQQTVVREVVLAGRSLRDTARLMQLSPMTVHRLLARGLSQLRCRLQADPPAGLIPETGPHRGPSAAPEC